MHIKRKRLFRSLHLVLFSSIIFFSFIFGVNFVRAAERQTPLIIVQTHVFQIDNLMSKQIRAASNIRFLMRHASVGNRIGILVAPDGSYSGLEQIKR